MREGNEKDHHPPGEDDYYEWKNGGKRKRQVWRILDTREMSVLTLLLVGFTLWNIFFIDQRTVDAQALDEKQVDELKNFITTHNPSFTNFSYDQLKQWFENQTPAHLKFEEYPRLYPFCVTHKLIEDETRTTENDHIYKFKEIFRSMEKVDERFYNFDVKKHSTIYQKNWIKNISLSRINTPELDMVNLRQWLHIKVETAEKVKGLYIQTIVGPMGLPFGEFYLDFPCKDDLPNTADMARVGQLSYCSYRPKAAIQHPSVYVGYDEKGRTEFHTHFFWTDITCMETPYLQFLMLVVKDFDYNATTKGKAKLDKQYKPLLSPIYLNTDFDSKSGAPFPYYPEWRDDMYCFLNKQSFQAEYKKNFPGINDPGDPLNNPRNQYPSTKNGSDPDFDPIDWQEDKQTFRIQPNEAYDACLTADPDNPNKKYNFDLRNDERLECPPGPFRCDTSYGTGNRDEVNKSRLQLVINENAVSKCNPCGAPPCEDIGFPAYKCDALPDEININVNESTELNSVENLIRGKMHGIQAMFAFLVIVPLANFIARFYKDVCDQCFCDNGPWIFVHIICHVLSLFFMWIAVGPVIPKLTEFKSVRKECKAKYPDSAKESNICTLKASFANEHVILATISFVVQHCLVGFGFWHSKNDTFRKVQVVLHSHFGYFCWLTGAISVIMATYDKPCLDLLFMTIFLTATPFFFTAAAVALDCMVDKKLGMIPPRKQWPVLEGVKLEGRGPLTIPKWIVFGAFTLVMIFIWLLALGTTLQLVGSTENLFEPVTEGKNKNPKLSTLFGDCSGGENLVAKTSSSITGAQKKPS